MFTIKCMIESIMVTPTLPSAYNKLKSDFECKIFTLLQGYAEVIRR